MEHSKIIIQEAQTLIGLQHTESPPPIGERNIVMSVCLCLCVCVCVRDHISEIAHPIFTNFWYRLPLAVARSCSCGVSTSGFMDDVIFAHKPGLLDVAAQLKRSAHAALDLAINSAQ